MPEIKAVGCSHCGKYSGTSAGVSFKCPHCGKSNRMQGRAVWARTDDPSLMAELIQYMNMERRA